MFLYNERILLKFEVTMLKQPPLNMNAQRSINLLVETLIELMAQKPLSDITISELTSAAGVVRNTYYAHFESKESLLSYHLYDLFRSKIQEALSACSPEDLELDLLYFQVCQAEIAFIKKLQENQLLHLLNHFGHHFNQLCDSFGLSVCCQVSSKAKPYADLVYADALASIVKQWMLLGALEPPEVLADIYREFIK